MDPNPTPTDRRALWRLAVLVALLLTQLVMAAVFFH